MSDLRRRLNSACAERDRLRRELEDLKAVVGWIDPEYSAALRDHQALALGRIRREGAAVSTPPSSQPPSYESRAYNDLRKERTRQRAQARYLRRRLRWIVDRDADPDDEPRTPHAVLPLPNKQTA